MGRFSALPTAAITDDSAVGGQIIQGSLIFDDDHNTFFHRDMVGGNRKVWTISYWTKLLDVNSTSSQRFWSAGDSGSGDVLKVEYYSGSSTRQIGFIDNNHASSGIRFTTDAHLQDNAWYHIVMAVDTTVGTAANRVKIYINGELQTLWSSGSEHNHPPNQNYDTAMNKASLGLAFGRAYAFGSGSATHFEGQMAELYLVDGQQLEATEFGYTESQTGIWRPKKFDRKGPNNGTTWSNNTSGNVYSGSAAGVFSGNLDANGINGNGDANNNHFTVSSLNVVASKVGVRISNASSDVEVSVNGSVVGTIAQGNIATNIASRHTFTFSERTVTSVKVRRVGSASGWFLYEIQLDDVPLINGNVSNMGQNGFYYPLDGSHHITKDLSGNGNDSIPYNLRGTVPFYMATGGLPILNTNKGGTVARPGVRPDPLASNIVLALPLSNRTNAVGFDVHHLIKGSGSPKTLSNNGSIANSPDYSNFYGRSGSAYIENASSQNVGISASNDFSMSTGDFTIECWIHPNSTSASDGSIFVTHDGSNYFAFNFSPSTGRFNIYLNSGSPVFSPATEEDMIEYTKWNHVALVKHSNVVKIYVNGLSIWSYNHSGQVGYAGGSTSSGFPRIGGGGSTALTLYMQDLRVYKGVAKYTDTFICGSFDTAIVPESPSVNPVSRTYISSSGSVGFEGTTSYLSIPHSTDLNLTNQDFCLEAFIYPTGSSNSQFGYVFNKGFSLQITFRDDSNSNRMQAFLASAGSGSYDILDGFSSGNDSVPLHQWSHIALIRTSGTVKWFINGVEKASTSASGTVHSNTDAFAIGTYLPSASNYEFKGSISNARITIGQAVYTSNFTPPSEPLTLTSQGVTSSNVKLLCCKDNNDETAADKIPTGSITRNNSAYATSFSPFNDDNVGRAGGYAVMNTLRGRKAGSMGDGNLLLTGANYTLQTSSIIFGPGNITTGKYFWEVDNVGSGTYAMYPGITSEFNQGAGEIAGQANKTLMGSHYHKLFNQTSGVSRTNEGVGTMSFALDVDNRILKGYYNTRLIFTDTSIPNATTTEYAPFIMATSGTWMDAFLNFGQRPFLLTPPEGYQTISSSNLEPSSVVNPKKHFGIVTYTGNNSTNIIRGLDFKPDFIWFKNRGGTSWHAFFDSVRGRAKGLSSNVTNADYTSGASQDLVSFDDNGFTLGTLYSWGSVNGNSNNNVAWCWKGGSPLTSSGGSVNFDGANGTNLRIANSADIQLGSTSNWTIEFWIKRTAAYVDYDVIIGKGASGTFEWFIEGFADGSVKFLYTTDGNTTWAGTHTIISSQALDRWYHVAIVRNGSGANNFKMYVDGTQTFQTTAFDIYAGTANLDIGGYGGSAGQDPPVVISNLRIVKGTSVYTSNFTPPTSPLTNITNTKLLCCQAIRSATEAAVTPGSITSNGGCHATSLNPFDAFSKDGVGYMSASDAGITNGTQPLTGASINTKAGFSIVTYCGNADGNSTFGHGLDQAPEIFFLKSRDNTENWRVYYTIADGSYDFMYLNTNGAVNNSGYALPNATVLNKADDANERMVAYCWHSVPGFSKMGSYYGNGSTDGKFVYTGFKPAFVLLKRHTDSANNWEIRDNKRVTNNPNNERLFPNTNNTKSVGEGIDFFSNGFKLRNSGTGSNSNDKVYIYMAFAEQPLTTQYGTQSNGE